MTAKTLIEASRKGITRDTIGFWMNTALRYERMGKKIQAAEAAKSARAVHFVYGPVHEDFKMSEATLARCEALIAAAP